MRNFVDSIIAKGEPWTDPDFRPERSSLYDPQHDLCDHSLFSGCKWERITKIFPGCQMIVDGIAPSDIIQGCIGDCYFLAVLASMAEFPSRVKDMIYTK